MIEDRSSDIQALRERVTHIGEYLHLDSKRIELTALEGKSAEPGFWDDQSSAQQVMSQAAGLRDEIEAYESLMTDIAELEVVNELAVADDDEELGAEAGESLRRLRRQMNDLEVASWFTG